MLINIVIGIAVIIMWVVFNALMLWMFGVTYYYITGVLTVIGIILLFILPQPYWTYNFIVVIAVGISNVAVGDILQEEGILDQGKHWT